MILDNLYIALRDRIQSANPTLDIKTIDWENGQAEQMESADKPRQDPLRLPAVLIRYEKPDWQAMGRLMYKAEATIYLDVVQHILDDPLTSDRDPLLVGNTRATYDLVNLVGKRCVRMRGPGIGTVGLIGYQQDHNFTKIRVDTIALRSMLTTDQDPTTYVHVATPTLVINGNPVDPPPAGREVVVRNSDDSYFEQITAPGALLLPNITHIDSDGTPVVLPAQTPFTAQLCVVPVCAPLTYQVRNGNNDVIDSGSEPDPCGKAITVYAANAQVQLQDTADVPIGTPVMAPAGDGTFITAPDGTVISRNTANTVVATTPVRSNQVAYASIGNSVLTKPDGTLLNLPATVALDIRTLRSGIVYQRGRAHWSGQQTSYAANDEAAMYAAGFFDVVRPEYPTHYAELGASFVLLGNNNIHGNLNRFTDRNGLQVYSDGIKRDHLTGYEWYYAPTGTGGWVTAITTCHAYNVGGNTDWYLPAMGVQDSIVNNNGGVLLNYAPFNIVIDIGLWTSTTTPTATSQALPLLSNGAYQSYNKGTSTLRWMAVRRFL